MNSYNQRNKNTKFEIKCTVLILLKNGLSIVNIRSNSQRILILPKLIDIHLFCEWFGILRIKHFFQP